MKSCIYRQLTSMETCMLDGVFAEISDHLNLLLPVFRRSRVLWKAGNDCELYRIDI
jgi:hypothetical protein